MSASTTHNSSNWRCSTRFGGLTDTRVKAQITRGERIRTLITQPRFAALRLLDEVALIAAPAAGLFDLPLTVIAEVRQRVAAYLDAPARESVAAITKTRTLDDAPRSSVASAVGDLAKKLSTDLEHKAAAT